MSDAGAVVVLGSAFGPLALTPDQLAEAQTRARELLPVQQQPATATTEDRILTAEQAAEITGVPASWFEEQMRRGTMEHLTFGKYRRLKASTILAHTANRAEGTPQTPKKKRRGNGRYRSATSSGAR